MTTAGTLNLVLGADSTKLRQELGKVRQDSQTTALAITNLFSGDTINAVGFRLIRGTVTGLIADIDDLNNGLSITDSLVNNLGASFADMGDIALLQLGQIAEFLGDDLFQTPLAGLQSASLENVGLGQLEGAFKIVTAGSNAVKILEVGLSGLSNGFEILDGVLNSVQAEAQSVADFFLTIAQSAELVSDILKTAATVIDGAIDLVLDSLEAVIPGLGLVREGAKALGLEFSIGKSLLGDYIDQLDRIEGAATGAAEGALDLSKAAGQARQGINQADAAVDEFGNSLKAQKQAAAGFESAIKDLADAGVLFDKYKQVSDIVDGALGSFEQNFQAASAAQNLENRLNLVSTSAGGASEDLAFLTDITTDLGVNFDAAAEGFTQFSTAATLANLTTTETKDIFESITQATAVMGLSAADTQGVFLALQQVLSSGNVQLEELNQIAERVPGTFQAAAAALGVTTSELKGLISTGKVDSKQFLIGFAQQLEGFTNAGVTDAMDSATASVNRFNNALGTFQIAAGKAWVEVGTPAINLFSKALEFAAKNEELFSTTIDAIGLTSLGFFIAGMGKAAIATYQFITANKTASITLLGNQLKLTGAALGQLAAGFAVAYVGAIVFFRTLDRVKDNATSTRAAIKSVQMSLVELAEISNGSNDLENLLPERPVARDWLDVPITAIRDLTAEVEESGNAFQKALVFLGDFSLVGVNKLVTFFKTGKYEITNFGEKAANDLLAGIGDLGIEIDKVLENSIGLREQTLLGEGPIKEVERLDAALKQLEQRKLGADPKDEKAVAAILAEEKALLQQRSDAQKEILANQSAVNNSIQQTKQELQDLGSKGLDAEAYESAKTQLEAFLANLEREKQKFDEVATVAVEQTQNIADAFKESNKTIEQSYSDRNAAIAEALASGQITEEQAREQSLASEKAYLEEKLRNNKDTLEKLKAELAKDTQLRAVDPSAAGLLSQDQLDQYKSQVTQLETETAQTRIELAQKVTDAKKEELDKELEDLEQANAEAEAALTRSQNNRIAAVRQRQLSGALTEQQAQAEISRIQQDGLNEQLDNEYNNLEKIKALRESGVLTVQEAAEKEREILNNISSLNLERLEADLELQRSVEAEKERLAQETLKAIEQANAQATAAIEQSQNDRVLAVRQAQLQGVIGEAAAAAQIEQTQADTVADTIDQKQREIDEVRRLRDQGMLSTEEAAEKEIQLNQEIGDLNLRRIESEIAAQQRLKDERIKAIQEEFAARQETLNSDSSWLGEVRNPFLDNTTDLLSAQLELSDAMFGLEQQRLETAKKNAEEAGNSNRAAQLQEQLFRSQNRQLIEQQRVQMELAKLENERRLNQAEIELNQAQLNQLAAQEAVIVAQAEGKSQEEIALLQRRLDLTGKIVSQAEANISFQEGINEATLETLRVNQQLERERTRQQQREARAQQAEASASSEGGSSEGEQQGNGSNSGRAETRTDGIVSYTTYSTRTSDSEESFDPATQYRGADGRIMNRRINAAGSAASSPAVNLLDGSMSVDQTSLLSGAIPGDSPLRSGGLSAATATDTSSVAQTIATGNQQVVAELQSLKQSILQLASSPRQLSVSSPDPIRDMGAILNTVSAQRSKAAKL